MKIPPALKLLMLLPLSSLAVLSAAEPAVIYLWSGVAPGSEGKTGEEKVRVTPDDGERVVSSVHRPSLTVYLPAPDKATGAALVVCPGGGHRELWTDHEGHSFAKWMAEHGVAAFVLKWLSLGIR